MGLAIEKRSGTYKVNLSWRNGRIRMTAYKDKAASVIFENNLKKLLVCRELNNNPDTELVAWLRNLPERKLKRFYEYGVVVPYQVFDAPPLTELLVEYRNIMMSKQRNIQHTRQEYNKTKRAIEACGFHYHADINRAVLQRWLAKLMNDATNPLTRKFNKGISPRTANSYISAFKAFCNWLIPEHATSNPLDGMEKYNEKGDVRVARRNLTPPELWRIVDAADRGECFKGMPGAERGMLYRVAIDTGLRWGELRRLRCGDFDLSEMRPTILVAATTGTKNPKKQQLPIRRELREALAEYFSHYAATPSAPVFPDLPSQDCGAEMVRFDLKNTATADEPAIPYEDELGEVADFHSLRHSFITNLASSGVYPKTVQALARHSTIKLTMDRYAHVIIDQQMEAVENLPSLPSQPIKVIV